MSVKLLITLVVVFLIATNRETVEARRLFKRQTVACYNGNTLLGYCYGGGTCVLVASNLYQCLCPNGAYAINCATQSGASSVCSPSCLNGGICNSGLCFCANGYSGSYCQIAPAQATTAVANSLCSSITCQNGGVCTVSSNLAYCNCANTGYTGPYCNIASSAVTTTQAATIAPLSGSTNPCLSISCLNGGLCVVISGAGYCACASGFTGSTCQIAPPTTQAPTTTAAATTTTTVATTTVAVTACVNLPGGNPCLNSAPCLAINNQPVCYCLLPTQILPYCTNPTG